MPTKTWVKIYDDLKLVHADVLEDDECCFGYRSGCTGEYCGGCVGCQTMQAAHSGLRIEYVDVIEAEEEFLRLLSKEMDEPSIWKFDLLVDLKLDG